MTELKRSSWYYSDLAVGGTSDKEYHLQIVKNGSLYDVLYQHGRRGGTLTAAKNKNTDGPVPLEKAERIYAEEVAIRLKRRYTQGNGEPAAAPVMPTQADSGRRTPFPTEELEEIDMDRIEFYLKSDQYVLEEKYDGQRRQIEKRADGTFIGYNHDGDVVSVEAEIASALRKATRLESFFIDGELIGNRYVTWEILRANGVTLTKMPYIERKATLRKAIKDGPNITYAPHWEGTALKTGKLAELRVRRAEGAAFKLKTAEYKGARSQHKKAKFWKSATCKVTALRHKDKDNAIVSLLKNGEWVPVGQVSMIGKDMRIELWSLVEVEFLYVGKGGKLVQPHIKPGPTGLRDDATESDCTFDQLKLAWKEGLNHDEN